MAATDDKTNFYVTQGSAASNTNGGSMNTGNGQTYTNDGPAETLTNVDAVDTGSGIYTLENQDSTGWGTTAVGDFICWDVDTNAEFVVVLSLNFGGDADVIQVKSDPSGGSITVGTGKTVKVGGAWATIDHPCDIIVSSTWTVNSNPITIWVKNGSYSELATIDNAGTVLLPITLEGYNTTEGDGWDFDWTGNLPTMDGGGISGYGIILGIAGGTQWIIKHIKVTDSTGTGLDFAGGNRTQVIHCESDTNDLNGVAIGTAGLVFACEIHDNLQDGVNGLTDANVIVSEIYNNTLDGVDIRQGCIISNILYNNEKNYIISISSGSVVLYNTIDGVFSSNPTSIGVRHSNSSFQISVSAFNIIHNCNIAFKAPAATGMNASFYNQWDNNNSANINWIPGEGDIEDGAGAPGFIDEASNNYQPTAASPANGAAGPTTSPSGNTTTNRAVGAAEPATVTSLVTVKLAGNGGGLVG